MKIGDRAEARVVASESNSAIAMKSGDMAVFATPSMVALMEQAATEAIKNTLPEGSSSVGTAISTTHSKATGIGVDVIAEATLKAIEGRKLTFDVVARDESGIIGEGSHERFIVDKVRFLSKL